MVINNGPAGGGGGEGVLCAAVIFALLLLLSSRCCLLLFERRACLSCVEHLPQASVRSVTMSSSVLEHIRSGHEDVERLEGMAAKALLEEPRTVRCKRTTLGSEKMRLRNNTPTNTFSA